MENSSQETQDLTRQSEEMVIQYKPVWDGVKQRNRVW